MSIPLTINGVTFNYPQQFDTNWGPTLTNWSSAVTTGMLQTSGVNAAIFIKSSTANPAASGVLRLAKTDAIAWRNNANNGDLLLTIDGSNNLTYNGVAVGPLTSLTNTHIYVGNASNVPTDVAVSGDIHITNAGVTTIQAGVVTGSKIASSTIAEANIIAGTITDASINAAAAIAVSKLASLTANKAAQLDASGFLSASATSSTELGYVQGATSNIQAQINAITGAGSFVSGMLIVFAGSSAPSGWLMCDGSAVSRSTYSALFGVISTTYGPGDGSTTFNLPNLVNNVPVGQGGSIVGSLGATAGATTHTLTNAELPTSIGVSDPGHRHQVLTTSITGVKNAIVLVDINARGMAATQSDPDSTSYSNVNNAGTQWLQSTTTGVTVGGSGSAHSIVQPSLGVNYIIKT